MLGTTTATKDEVLEKRKDFDKLFRDHRVMVFRAAYSVVKCRQDAEDVSKRFSRSCWMANAGPNS